MTSDPQLPFYIQKAADLNLLKIEDGKIAATNKDAISTVMSTVRLIEKLQPSTIADRDETVTQESIVLCRVLTSASGAARELWSQLRTAFGVGHGQELPANLWSMPVLRTIAKEIDLTFIGERTGKIISPNSLITSYENLPRSELEVPFSDFCTTISELSSPATMQAFGDADSEWDTALDILKQKRVLSIYKDTLYQASQYLKTDPKLEKALEFVHGRMMEGIGMLSGSIGNQCQVIDLSEAIVGDPGSGRLNWADYIISAKNQDQPVSTGVDAFDLDIEGGVTPPRPHMPRAGRLMVIGARTGVGKCLGFNTPVIMADGSVRPIQDIKENDLVLGPDGTPRRVHGLARGRSEMYRIVQQNGDTYTVNDVHVLSLRVTGGPQNTLTINGIRYCGGDIVNIEVLDYLNLSTRAKHLLKGWKPESLEFHGAPVYDGPLTPYLAGVYLGDGKASSPKFYLSDFEIIKELRIFCSNNDYKLKETEEPGCFGCSILTGLGPKGNPVLNWIHENDFVGQGKHIPEALKRGTNEQRLEVLAGIIDTDGCVSNNCFDITVKEKRFAQDITFVARSLGLRAKVKQCQKTIKSLSFIGTYYRVTISGNTSKVPTRVLRKQCSPRKQIKNVLNTGIKVEPIGVDDYYGFALDGPDRLYLLGDFTVTHNTALGVHVASSLARGGLTIGFVSAELDSRAIEARIIANLSKSLISPYHWRAVDRDCLGFVTVGELELPGATKSQSKVAQVVATVAQKLQEKGGKILVEAPWGACVDTCINTMRSMKARDPELRAIVIDHFHALARHKGGSMNNPSAMLEDRAYRLMTAAKELDVDLFVLAQLNRVGLDLGANDKEPQLNEIRGTDALAHVAHATWLVRRVRSGDSNDESNRDLEVWHSKVRGRQAVWKEGEGILESIKGFHEKSIISIDYETASVRGDSTNSDIIRKKTSMGL